MMRKKYVIAQNKKQRDNNFKYIVQKDNLEKKEKNEVNTIRDCLISVASFFRHDSIDLSFEQRICRLYMDEIELFYINNYFDRRYLQIKRVYLIKIHEMRYGIRIPIILSILATVIYTVFFEKYGEKLLKNVVIPLGNILQKFCELLESLLEGDNLKNSNIEVFGITFEIAMLILLFGFLILLTAFTISKVIDLFVIIFGGINFCKEVAEKYEIEYIEKLVEQDQYHVLSKKMQLYEERFFSIICLLTYNYLIRSNKKFDIIDNLEREVEKELLHSTALNELERLSSMFCDKKIVIKSLICRVYRQLNGKGQRLELIGDKIYLKM